MVSDALYYAAATAVSNEINSYFPTPKDMEMYKPGKLKSTLVIKCTFDPDFYDEYEDYYYYFILHIGPTYNMPIIREYGIHGVSEADILPMALPVKRPIPIPLSNEIRKLYYEEFRD